MEAPPVIDTTPSERTNTFPRQLRFWGLHCGLTALPSFCIALVAFNGVPAIAAMLCGVATFVLGYAFLTSTSLYGKVHAGLIGRSIKLGTRIRMIISVASLPLLIPIIGTNLEGDSTPPGTIMFVPDFWFGYLAIMISMITFNLLSPHGNVQNMGFDSFPDDFFFAYLTTLLEGMLISVSLVFIAFFTLIVLNFRRNRRHLPTEQIPRHPGGSA